MSSSQNARQQQNQRITLSLSEVSALQREMAEADVSHAANVIKEMLRQASAYQLPCVFCAYPN